VFIHGENLGKVFTLPFFSNLFEAHGEGLFDVRTVELGHLQNGGNPSPQVHQ
jgi:6-phosphofructokinase 1